jgi:hypothetical protein
MNLVMHLWITILPLYAVGLRGRNFRLALNYSDGA